MVSIYIVMISNYILGPTHNYTQKNTNLKKDNEIIVVMDMNKGTLKFMTNNEEKGDSYRDIPLDKSLFPSVILYYKNDSVEIIECELFKE